MTCAAQFNYFTSFFKLVKRKIENSALLLSKTSFFPQSIRLARHETLFLVQQAGRSPAKPPFSGEPFAFSSSGGVNLPYRKVCSANAWTHLPVRPAPARAARPKPGKILTCPAGTPRRASSPQSPLPPFPALRGKLRSLPCVSSPHVTRSAGLTWGPPRSCPARNSLTCPAGTPRRAAPCPPGTPGRRRRRWRCGSSGRRSPAGPRPPPSRRRPQW